MFNHFSIKVDRSIGVKLYRLMLHPVILDGAVAKLLSFSRNTIRDITDNIDQGIGGLNEEGGETPRTVGR